MVFIATNLGRRFDEGGHVVSHRNKLKWEIIRSVKTAEE